MEKLCHSNKRTLFYHYWKLSVKQCLCRNKIYKITRNNHGFAALETAFWLSLILYTMIKTFEVQQHFTQETNKLLKNFEYQWQKTGGAHVKKL